MHFCSLKKRSDKYYPLSSNTPLKKAIPMHPVACNSKRVETGFLNPTTILHPLLVTGKKIVLYHLYYSLMSKGWLHPLGQVLNQNAKHLGPSRIQTLIYMSGVFILNVAASTFWIMSTFMSVVHLHIGATEFRHMFSNPDLVHSWVIIHYRLDPFPLYQMEVSLMNDLFVAVQVPCNLISPVFFQSKTRWPRNSHPRREYADWLERIVATDNFTAWD